LDTDPQAHWAAAVDIVSDLTKIPLLDDGLPNNGIHPLK
jgi:hypothetical protein